MAAAALKDLDLDLLKRGRYQPRTEFAAPALEELAASIRENGVIQPIVARPDPAVPGRYEIVAGERRWRAAQLAQLPRVPVIVRELSDQEAAAVALIENDQRENLNPVETAKALARLVNEFGFTQEDAGAAIGRSREYVTNAIRLLSLPEQVLQLLTEQPETFTAGHAKALLALKGDPGVQQSIANAVVRGGLSVRKTEAMIASYRSGGQRKQAAVKDPNVLRVERALSEKFGSPVTIDYNAGEGRGTITIECASLEIMDGVIEQLERG